MDHVVYLDAQAKELEKILAGDKTMIIRGATGRKLPYGRVDEGDQLFFINNNGEGEVKAKAKVELVINSDKMTKEQSMELVNQHQPQLQLTAKQFKRWAGKRYLVLIAIKEVEVVESFEIDKSQFGNMDDWLLVEEIDRVKL